MRASPEAQGAKAIFLRWLLALPAETDVSQAAELFAATLRTEDGTENLQELLRQAAAVSLSVAPKRRKRRPKRLN